MGQIAANESALRRWAIRGHVNVFNAEGDLLLFFAGFYPNTHPHFLSFVSVVCKGLKCVLLLAAIRHYIVYSIQWHDY